MYRHRNSRTQRKEKDRTNFIFTTIIHGFIRCFIQIYLWMREIIMSAPVEEIGLPGKSRALAMPVQAGVVQ